MGKFKSKIGKRIMALFLSGALMMSNMTVSASELSEVAETEVETETAIKEETQSDTLYSETELEEKTTEEVSEKNEEKTEEKQEETLTESASTEKTLTEDNELETSEIENSSEEETAEEKTTDVLTEELTDVEEFTTEELITEEEKNENGGVIDEEKTLLLSKNESGKIDVWDFGAEQLDTDKYNNMLTEDIINGWYPGVAAGSDGKNIASFAVKDNSDKMLFEFNDGGYPTTHRLRSKNEKITRYDGKSLKDLDGNEYKGYIYSNKGATDSVYLGITLEAGDILTLAAASNGNDSNVTVANPSGVESVQTHTLGGSTASIMTFYADESGEYKIYSTNEKLVVARAYVEDTAEIEISGSVMAPSDLKEYSLVFTNDRSGAITKIKPVDGKYTVTLNEQYSYSVALENANGYIIAKGMTLDIAKGVGNTIHDIEIQAVSLVDVKGSISGLSADELKKLKLSFESDNVYVPEIDIDTENSVYTATLETGVEYLIVAEGVNDYTLEADKISSTASGAEINLKFNKKPTYKVTIKPEGATAADLAAAKFVFTNLEEEEYIYTFTGTDGIALRDGVYSVEVKESGIFIQQLTSNVKVNGVEVEKTIKFKSDITEWNFTDKAFIDAGFNGEGTYNGLHFTNAKSHNDVYLYSGAGTISVPVKGDCVVSVTANYQYSYYFASENEPSVNIKTGSTSQNDTFTYNYTGDAGTVNITVLGSSYITKIVLTYQQKFKPILTVGAQGCDYTTINAALNAAKSMDRPNSERVTIEIQPGDYEEMLVIDTPNVTLKNASATPSIKTKDKGVNIDENAVRITSYYGHGYTYYSMGSDCKYSDEIFEVNKENGYPSFENPGSGTTSGSYWNATVVISADGFEADGIIFENSFNQYVSKKAANDIIVKQSGAKEGTVPRADMQYGDTTVQNKKYVERAAALAITDNCNEVFFDNCKFIGRQDTLYGGTGVKAGFYDCSVYGGTDYIFGAMTAVFAKCDLVLNTMEDKNDVAYITAAQQKSGRGYLMYNCNVVSTEPGVDTASEELSKPGYLGRPWQANTSEVVFYATVIDKASDGTSLIAPIGWNNTLGGISEKMYEYGTYEMAENTDNQSFRADWAKTLSEPVLSDGSAITIENFLGNWNPFTGKNMTVEYPAEKLWIAKIETPTYTGAAVTPDVKVYVGSMPLKEGIDYSVTYQNNINAYLATDDNYKNAKVPTAVVKGIGGYQGTVTRTFDISPVDLSSEAVVISDMCVEADGKAKNNIIPEVIFNGEALKNNKDFTVEYPSEGDYTKADQYEVKVIASKGSNFQKDKTVKLYVVDKNDKTKLAMSKAKISFIEKPQAVYDKYAHEPQINVTYGNGRKNKLVEGKDYIVSYKNNVNVGKATVVVTGTGKKYIGTKTITFDIKKQVLKKNRLTVTFNENKERVYLGTPVTFENLVVRAAGVKLEKDKDYTVAYKNNNKAGNATLTISGRNNYTGSVAFNYKIKALDICAEYDKEKNPYTFEAVAEKAPYSKGGAVSKITLTLKTTGEVISLKEGIDFKVSYKNNKSIGTKGLATIKGINGFKGMLTREFDIVAADLADMKVVADDIPFDDKSDNYIANIKVYDKQNKELKKDVDYTCTYLGADGVELASGVKLDKGSTVIVKVSAKSSNYTGTNDKTTFRILAAENIRKAKIGKIKINYNTKSNKLSADDFKNKITVKVGSTIQTLEYGTDFIVIEDSYKNIDKAGKASVTIQGIGNYGGTKVVTYTIDKQLFSGLAKTLAQLIGR